MCKRMVALLLISVTLMLSLSGCSKIFESDDIAMYLDGSYVNKWYGERMKEFLPEVSEVEGYEYISFSYYHNKSYFWYTYEAASCLLTIRYPEELFKEKLAELSDGFRASSIRCPDGVIVLHSEAAAGSDTYDFGVGMFAYCPRNYTIYFYVPCGRAYCIYSDLFNVYQFCHESGTEFSSMGGGKYGVFYDREDAVIYHVPDDGTEYFDKDSYSILSDNRVHTIDYLMDLYFDDNYLYGHEEYESDKFRYFTFSFADESMVYYETEQELLDARGLTSLPWKHILPPRSELFLPGVTYLTEDQWYCIP